MSGVGGWGLKISKNLDRYASRGPNVKLFPSILEHNNYIISSQTRANAVRMRLKVWINVSETAPQKRKCLIL